MLVKEYAQHKVVEDAKDMNLLFLNNDVDVSYSQCPMLQSLRKANEHQEEPGYGSNLI